MSSKFKIHKVKFSNFHTFLDDAEISFVLDEKNHAMCGGVKSCTADDIYLSPVITIAGSERGRRNSIKPLIFVAEFISGRSSEVFSGEARFRTHPFSMSGCGSVVILFELNEKIYRYVVEFKNGRVNFESLHVKTSKLFSCVFEKNARKSLVHSEIKVAKLGLSEERLKSITSNISIVSASAEMGSSLGKDLVSAFSGIARCEQFSRPEDIIPSDVLNAADVFFEHEGLRRKMVSFLSAMDQSLMDIVFEKNRYDFGENCVRELNIPYMVRRASWTSKTPHTQPIWHENRDVLTVFVQLSRVLPALDCGGVVVMDRLDEGVPDETLPSIIELFLQQDTNPQGAQLLFTANSLDVLKCMQANQIYLIRGGHYQRRSQPVLN